MNEDRHAPEEMVKEHKINLTIMNVFSLDYSEGLANLPLSLASLELLTSLHLRE
jgi:hypothetical protein